MADAPTRRSGDPEPHAHAHFDLEAAPQSPHRQDAVATGSIYSNRDSQRRSSVVGPRMITRTATFKNIEDFEEFNPDRPGWRPGAEPGLDPAKTNGGHESMPDLHNPCEITVVDYSQDEMEVHRLDNDGLIEFLETPRPAWAKCRWVNVNGLSWDVIQALGKYKKLHSLALEDVVSSAMNTRNRTKVDWYSNHAFIVLTLQKLVHLVEGDDDSDAKSMHKPTLFRGIRNVFTRGKRGGNATRTPDMFKSHLGHQRHETRLDSSSDSASINVLHPIQQYSGTSNDASTDFMMRHSPLTSRNLAVSAEQVSMFLCSDNTLVTFFETSAGEVERPILTRLDTSGTILRESCDASLLVQAVTDAIIDLAIPLTAVYRDVIRDLELEVLTSPSLKQSKQLYIVISEINQMLVFLNPIDNLINMLRDHKTDKGSEGGTTHESSASSSVTISHQTHTYLGDVLDHTIMIVEAFVQMKHSCDNLISLIFNTISSAQNESMKQLTTFTIVFLPLTFVTGYFGMNFQPFDVLQYDVQYFWQIVGPTVVATIIILFAPVIYRWLQALMQRKHYFNIKKQSAGGRRNRNNGQRYSMQR